jgi:uncharacterized membrane protein (DUF106 family)
MFGRIQFIIIGAVLLFSVLSGIYYSWRKGIEREALLEYNQKQLEQHQKDQEEFRKRMEEIKKQQEEIAKKNEEEKKIFNDKMRAAADYLESAEVKKDDRPASSVLKETVRKLKDAPK